MLQKQLPPCKRLLTPQVFGEYHPEKVAIDEAQWHSLRQKDITGTDAAILFNAGTFEGQDIFTLYQRKHKGVVIPFTDKDLMFWGNQLESAIVKGVYELEGWGSEFNLMHMGCYHRRPDGIRAGATLDWGLFNKEDPEHIILLSVKNVSIQAFEQDWTTYLPDGSKKVAPPLAYETQMQHELYVTGLHYHILVALVGGNAHKLFIRQRDETFISELDKRIKQFWEMQVAPKVALISIPEKTLRNMFKPKDVTVDLSHDYELLEFCSAYSQHRKQKQDEEKWLHAARNKIRLSLEGAKRARVGDFQITISVDNKILIKERNKKFEEIVDLAE